MSIADHPHLAQSVQLGALSKGPLLARKRHAGRAVLPVVGDMVLALGRVHEVCGPARRTLALAIAAAMARDTGGGQVVWISPSWTQERLNGEGVTEWLDPGRMLLVQPDRAEDLLWAMEETLRAGVVPLVVAELPEPPGLTPVRRLHLAAEAGCGGGRITPFGLILTPGEGGAAGVESRWRLEPAHDGPRAMRWRLARLRERASPPGLWAVRGARGSDRRWMLHGESDRTAG